MLSSNHTLNIKLLRDVNSSGKKQDDDLVESFLISEATPVQKSNDKVKNSIIMASSFGGPRNFVSDSDDVKFLRLKVNTPKSDNQPFEQPTVDLRHANSPFNRKTSVEP